MPGHTIAENLQRLLNAKSAISNAITEKGGTVSVGDGLEDFATDIGTIPSGGGGASRKDVNFIDYDGTIVHSYTAAEFAELTEFPSNPSHDGLTAQGWNWSTLAEAKSHVAKYGILNIGQIYKTSDGKTRIFIELDEYRREPVLGLGVNGSVDIDWGDGSAHTTLTGTNVSTYVYTQPHTYPSGGEYVIALTVTGTIKILGRNSKSGLLIDNGQDANKSQTYYNSIKRVYIGDNISIIDDYAFCNCYSIASISIPNTVTEIKSNAFYYCTSLKSISFPYGMLTIGNNAFQFCSYIKDVSFSNSINTIYDSAFRNCISIEMISLPDNVSYYGSFIFGYCNSLRKAVLIKSGGGDYMSCLSLASALVQDLGTINGSTFNSCKSLGCIKFIGTIPATVGNANAFKDVPTDCVILVKSYAYLSASNYPSPSTYTYAYYDTFASGATLPATIPDESTTSLTWYATIADLRAETNPITVGNGKEVYAKMTSTV